MKKLLLIASLFGVTACTSHRVKITSQATDERGLTSVQFIQDGKEYALDYLTETEYLKLINR